MLLVAKTPRTPQQGLIHEFSVVGAPNFPNLEQKFIIKHNKIKIEFIICKKVYDLYVFKLKFLNISTKTIGEKKKKHTQIT